MSRIIVNEMPESPSVCPLFGICKLIHGDDGECRLGECPVVYHKPHRCPYLMAMQDFLLTLTEKM